LTPTANPNTESARRDNVQRETIPQTSALENAAKETAVGSESDRARAQGQQSQPLVYERPQNSSQPSADSLNQGTLNQDNAEDPSAGKQDAETRQQQRQQTAEQTEIRELKARDAEIRAHEQAHAAIGGQYAGAPQYEFETGPDGRQYAVGGEVSIDISEESSPEETLRKMQQVRAAALAPAEPSPQDLRVAQEAIQKANQARSEIVRERADKADSVVAEVFPNNQTIQRQQSDSSPDPQGLVGNGQDTRPPTRTLDEDPVAEAIGLETDAQSFLAEQRRDPEIAKRISVIEGFYQNIAQPRTVSFQQTP
jgi:hypothetical protein